MLLFLLLLPPPATTRPPQLPVFHKCKSDVTMSGAERSRIGWCVVPAKKVSVAGGPGQFQLHTLWSSKRGVTLWSKAGRTAVTKSSFGAIADIKYCDQVRDKKSQETISAFLLTNRSGSNAPKRLEEFNPGIWKFDDYTKSVIRLRTEGKEEELARYLSLMVKEWQGQEDVVIPDGDKEAYEKFKQEAEASAEEVEATSQLILRCRGGEEVKRQESKKEKAERKLNVAEQMEKDRREEVERKDSLETEMQRKYILRTAVKIDKVHLSEDIEKESPVDQDKVTRLETEMCAWFDPAQMVLTVTPDNPNYDADKYSDRDEYTIIHGRHRLLALQSLMSRGILKHLVGMEEGTVLCWVMRGGKGVLEMGLLKGNAIQSMEVREPRFLDVLDMGQVMLNKTGADKEETIELVKRWCKLKKINPEDIKTIAHILDYPEVGVTAAREVIRLFETYQTKDNLDVRKVQGKLRRGEVRNMTKILFRKFKKIDGPQMCLVETKVKSKEVSVDEAVSGVIKQSCREGTLRKMSEIMKVSVVGIKTLYVEKEIFKMEDLDLFAKADVTSENFKTFCKGVKNANVMEAERGVLVLDNVKAVEQVKIEDTIVISADDSKMEELTELLLNSLARNKDCSILVLTKSEDVALKADKMLARLREFDSIRIYIEDEGRKVKDGIFENVILGVISGTVYTKPLSKHNSFFSATIDSIIDRISPVNAFTTVFLMSTEPRPFLLSQQKDQRVQYVTGVSVAAQVQALLRGRGAPAHQQVLKVKPLEEEEVLEQDDGVEIKPHKAVGHVWERSPSGRREARPSTSNRETKGAGTEQGEGCRGEEKGVAGKTATEHYFKGQELVREEKAEADKSEDSYDSEKQSFDGEEDSLSSLEDGTRTEGRKRKFGGCDRDGSSSNSEEEDAVNNNVSFILPSNQPTLKKFFSTSKLL